MRRRLRASLIVGAVAAFGLSLAPTVTSAFSSGFDAAPVSLAARGGIGSFTTGLRSMNGSLRKLPCAR